MTTPDGFLLVDKPPGLTSHDVVARVRRALGTRKVGHAGTLDPMATGLLVVGVNRATRLLTYAVGADKTYTATIRLGQTTTTEDADGEILTHADASSLTESDISAAATKLTGEIDQVPSAVSAIKVDGVRAYTRVRQGEDVELPARRVRVDRFEVLALRAVDTRKGVDAPLLDVDVVVECSSGTYVRALARDLGEELGVGGHLVALRRTRVGPFDVAGAVTLDELDSTDLRGWLSIADAASAILPVHRLSVDQARELSFGRPIADACGGTREHPVAGIGPGGTLVAILYDRDPGSWPTVVFAPA
jgi:tRNA pseudouridine55 synthase